MLIGFGIKKETADIGLVFMTHDVTGEEIEPEFLGCAELWGCEERRTVLFSRQRQIPAWSLHRLVKMLPCVIDAHPILHLTLMPDAVFYTTENNDEDHERPFSIHGNIYDNIIDCVEWLIQQGHFNEDYLV